MPHQSNHTAGFGRPRGGSNGCIINHADGNPPKRGARVARLQGQQWCKVEVHRIRQSERTHGLRILWIGAKEWLGDITNHLESRCALPLACILDFLHSPRAIGGGTQRIHQLADGRLWADRSFAELSHDSINLIRSLTQFIGRRYGATRNFQGQPLDPLGRGLGRHSAAHRFRKRPINAVTHVGKCLGNPWRLVWGRRRAFRVPRSLHCSADQLCDRDCRLVVLYLGCLLPQLLQHIPLRHATIARNDINKLRPQSRRLCGPLHFLAEAIDVL